jgi:hypothetical protein
MVEVAAGRLLMGDPFDEGHPDDGEGRRGRATPRKAAAGNIGIRCAADL